MIDIIPTLLTIAYNSQFIPITSYKLQKLSPNFPGHYAHPSIPTDNSAPFVKSRLVTPSQRADGTLCVSFWYQASSSHENTVAVIKRYNRDNEVRLLEIAGK